MAAEPVPLSDEPKDGVVPEVLPLGVPLSDALLPDTLLFAPPLMPGESLLPDEPSSPDEPSLPDEPLSPDEPLLPDEPPLSEPPDPVSDGDALGEGLLLGLLVAAGDEGGALDVTGCGDDEEGSGCGCAVSVGEGAVVAAVAAAVVVPAEGTHDGTGADSRAIAGTTGLRAPRSAALAGTGGVAEGSAALPCSAVAPGRADEGLADSHCGPRFVIPGASEPIAPGTADVVRVPDPAPADVAAELGPGIALLRVSSPSTLAGWPPVSTLELTCTTA